MVVCLKCQEYFGGMWIEPPAGVLAVWRLLGRPKTPLLAEMYSRDFEQERHQKQALIVSNCRII